ncbi:glycosyltransferase [Natronomonas amylolytica]|uniref:glycosyltransferase n=1 Tax=Natronomonas amylolytica TaxID=3108498 RepID=UPI00300BDFA2
MTLRVAFLVDTFPRESQRFIVNQVTGLLDRGHEVTVYSTNRPDEGDFANTHHDLVEYTVYTPIPTNRKRRVIKSGRHFLSGALTSPLSVAQASNPLQFGKDALSLRPLYRLAPMLRKSFDIVHVHFGPNGRIAAILKQIGMFGSFVTTLHGFGVRQAREHPEQYSRLFAVGDRFLANSQYTYQQLRDLGVDEEKLELHYNSIEVEEFPFRWSGPLQSIPEPLKLITVGRLEDVKGIEHGLRAVAQLQEGRDEPIEYHVVGDGSRRPALESLAEKLGIGSAVTFHGHRHRDEVKDHLSESHLFILPSVEEAFGMVLVEAQAVGLPIVASDVGGIPEAVREGVTAKLVPPGESQAIAAGLEGWINRFDEWPEIGAEGREYAKSKFEKNALIDELIKIYRETR